MDYLSVLNIASVAVLSSFSHCIGMCGGFISLQALFLRGKSGMQATVLSLLYHLCRVGAYTCLGALAGGLSGALIIGKNARAGLFFAVGCALIFIGAALYFRGGMLKFLENEKISKFIALKALKFSKKQGVLNLCALGFLNGLLPCGVVYYFLAQAISYGSAVSGAAVAAIYGLCTIPALLCAQIILRRALLNFRQAMFKISTAVIVLNGVYLAFSGLRASE